MQAGRLSAKTAISAAALASILTLSFVNALTGNTVNEIVDEFKLAGTGEGLMGSMVSVGFMLSLLIIPMAQGRIGKTTVLIAACAVQAVFVYAGGVSPGFAFFCAMWVMIGFSGGFLDTYANSCIVDIRGSESPKYLGYLHGLYGIGSLVAPLAIFGLFRYMDWRGIYYIVAAVSLLAVPVMYALTRRRDMGEIHVSTNEQRLRADDIKSYIRQKRNLMLSATAFFLTISQHGLMVWTMRFMKVEYDAAALGALAMSLYWVFATINRFALAQVISRAPMKFLILGAALIGTLVTAGVLSANAVVMCVMIVATGLAGGHFVPVLVSESARGYTGKTTFTTSLIMLVMGIARTAAPLAMAFASGRLSMKLSMTVPIAAAVFAVLFGWMTLRADRLYEKRNTL